MRKEFPFLNSVFLLLHVEDEMRASRPQTSSFLLSRLPSAPKSQPPSINPYQIYPTLIMKQLINNSHPSYLTFTFILIIYWDLLVVPTYQLPIISGESSAAAATTTTFTITEEDSSLLPTEPSLPPLEVFFDDPTPSPPQNDLVEDSTTLFQDEPDEVSTNIPSLSSSPLLEEDAASLRLLQEETSTDPQDEDVVKFVDVPEDFTPKETTPSHSFIPEEEDDSSTTRPLTSEILDELNSLWVISEQMDDEVNSGLKRSLTSLVHMTYARVYDFDEDTTLSKLKTLLRLLRSKLSSPSHSVERRRRSLKEKPSSLTSKVNELKVMMTSPHSSRRKNNSRFALEDSFGFPSYSDEQNSLVPSFSWDESNSLKNEYEITHEKNPQEKWESHDDSSSTPITTSTSTSTSTTTPLPPSTSSSNVALPLVVTKTGVRPPPLTVISEKDFSTSEDVSKFHSNSSSVSSQTESTLAATVDEILASIVAILNEPQRSPPPSHPQVTDFSPPTPSNSSSSLPFYLNSFFVDVPLISSSSSSSSNSINKMGDFSTPPVETNSTGTSTGDSTGMSTLPQPLSTLNSTMERIVMVFTIFSNLSTSSRMTLAFATAIAAVILAIGYFVMGAPMIVVGVLFFVLTLFFFASLNFSAAGKKKKRIDAQDEDVVLMSEETTAAILSLIADAVQLYKHSQQY